MAAYEPAYTPPGPKAREQLEQLLAGKKQVLPYVQPWYLDAVAPGQWGLVAALHPEGLAGGLPVFPQKKGVWKYSYQPPFVQQCGPVVAPWVEQRKQPQLEQHKVIAALAEALPKDWAAHTFAGPLQDYLPFLWKGYQLNLKYTYTLAPGAEGREPMVLFHRRRRQEVRQLSKHFQLRPLAVEGLSELFRRAGKNFQQPAYTRVLPILLRAAHSRQCLWLRGAYANEELTGAVAIISGAGRWINLINVTATPWRKQSPVTVLLAEAISAAHASGAMFDFEGSVKPGIARFFQYFGAVPEPYVVLERKSLGKLTL